MGGRAEILKECVQIEAAAEFLEYFQKFGCWPGATAEFLEIFQKFGRALGRKLFARKFTISLARPGFAKVQQGGRGNA